MNADFYRARQAEMAATAARAERGQAPVHIAIGDAVHALLDGAASIFDGQPFSETQIGWSSEVAAMRHPCVDCDHSK